MQSLRIVFVKLKPVSRLMTEVQMKPLTLSGGSSSRQIPLVCQLCIKRFDSAEERLLSE